MYRTASWSVLVHAPLLGGWLWQDRSKISTECSRWVGRVNNPRETERTSAQGSQRHSITYQETYP